MDTTDLVAQLRRTGVEPTNVEVKAAVRALPSSVPETITAFANGTGGTLLLGLDEGAGFTVAPDFRAEAIRDSLVDACTNKIEPICRAPVEIEPFEGALVVRLDVPELDPVDKPCFVTTRGTYGGSFIRGGDGDRLLSHYEVTQLLSNRTQPTVDRDPVPGATLTDLDSDLLDRYLTRVRRRSLRLAAPSDEQLLRILGVLTTDSEGQPRPTLAGLLAFGIYPQQFYPQLFVSFVVLPRLRMGETGPDGRRFLDNVTVTGPIPEIVASVIATAVRNMRAGAIITGIGREDRYDYPIEVIRELTVNAVLHRDYSADARGAQVQIELYPDRLEIRSPGGLYGPITIADLGSDEHRSTSRNQTLAAILADVEAPGSRGEALCENRGSGLHSVLAELRRVGMSPPEFDVRPGRMTVRLPQSALLSPETAAWIGSLGVPDLSESQHLALAMMRSTGRVTNAMLQAWGVDRLQAGVALKDLVDRSLALRTGGRRYASYQLTGDANASTPTMPLRESRSPRAVGAQAELDAVLQAIAAGYTTRRALMERLGLPQRTLARRLTSLIERGAIEPTQPTRSHRQSYRLAVGRSTDHGQ
ncbi:MAG: putative DNA binding domain-containing protein [Kineosporiaceae bacterium]|nr:putative DNA binding domain-containing protein [Kineosporiaceae bacterium]